MSEPDILEALNDAFGGMPSESDGESDVPAKSWLCVDPDRPAQKGRSRGKPETKLVVADHYVVRCPHGCGEVAVRRTTAAALVVAQDHANAENHPVSVSAYDEPEPVKRPAFEADARTAEAIRSLKPADEGVRFGNGAVVKTPALARLLKHGIPLPGPPAPVNPPAHRPPMNPWEGIIEQHLKELGLGVPKDKLLSDNKYRRLCFELAYGEDGGGFVRMRGDGLTLEERGDRVRRGEERLRLYMERTGWAVEEAPAPKGAFKGRNN